MGSTIYANNGTTSKLYFSTAYGLLFRVALFPCGSKGTKNF